MLTNYFNEHKLFVIIIMSNGGVTGIDGKDEIGSGHGLFEDAIEKLSQRNREKSPNSLVQLRFEL
jgi:hypothetical protein